MARAVNHRTRLVVFCNPNNPTATALDASGLHSFADRVPTGYRPGTDRVPTDVLIVIDEAYREYAAATAVPDALPLLGDRPIVVVLRTLPSPMRSRACGAATAWAGRS
ncbi:aminotransferase class I/II-fold pyridoxal phosphate-dependent enzyme [Streptacidiphilus carbonis]|uniref:aminotransferase class I/II-fold pyridoxal phosphate-dependent enzyme n=1 Tax=Streptacidiphilus carbonis TaxID=105422 RepID=UPI0006935404|nr:aminotransferase class I/II-fold pyridoxal phosphate-dependent enzyme [Streptacidiphilus carbonis]